MKRLLPVFLLCLLASLPGEAETIELNAFTTPRAYVHNGDKVNQRLRHSANGPKGRPATRLSWDSSKKNYAELNLRNAPAFPELSALEVQLEYHSDGNGEVITIGFRMFDTKNECFQWIVPAHDNTPGWKTIRATLAPDRFSDSWGKQKTGKI